MLVLVEVFQRVAGKDVPLALDEQVLQGQVDRPHGAMKIDGPEQLGADGDESHQGRQPALVDREPLGGEHGVVQQAVEVECPGAIARHVGVAEHEVHVVDRIEAAEQAAEESQPARPPFGVGGARPGDEKGDVFRVERFLRLQDGGWECGGCRAAGRQTPGG